MFLARLPSVGACERATVFGFANCIDRCLELAGKRTLHEEGTGNRFLSQTGEGETLSKRTVMLRLVINDPVPGVTYSLQDKKSSPVDPVVAGSGALSFDVPVQVAPGSKVSGDFVRREGAERRFVYIAIGAQAGDQASEWSRRVKVDVHDLPSALLEEAVVPSVLQCELPGRAKDGSPACATLRPINGWRVPN